MAAPPEDAAKPGAAIPIADLSLQFISRQNLPDAVVTAPAIACHHARLIDGGLSQLLQRKSHLSKGYLTDSLDLKEAPASKADQEFLSKALLSYLDLVQQLEDAQDTQDVLRSHLSVASCHAAASESFGSVDALRHVVSLLSQLEDPSVDVGELEVKKILDSLPELQPDEDVETSVKSLPEMAIVYRNLLDSAESRWRAKAEALEELGRCWRHHHSLKHGAASKKAVTVVYPPPPGAAQARPMAGMGGMMGMGGMGGMGGPGGGAPAPVTKEEMIDVEVDADLDLIRVIETSTIAKDLAAARDIVVSVEVDDGGLMATLLYKDVNDERGLELLVYLRLVRALTDYLKGNHELGFEPLTELAKLLSSGQYGSGKQSQLSPARLQELAQEALSEVLRAFRQVLHPDPKTSEEMCTTLAKPLALLVTDPEIFLTTFSEAIAAQKEREQQAAAAAAAATAAAAAAAAAAATAATAAPAPAPREATPAAAATAPDVTSAATAAAVTTETVGESEASAGEPTDADTTAVAEATDAAAADLTKTATDATDVADAEPAEPAADVEAEGAAPVTGIAEAIAAAVESSVQPKAEAETTEGEEVKVTDAIAAAVGEPASVEVAEAKAEVVEEGGKEEAAEALVEPADEAHEGEEEAEEEQADAYSPDPTFTMEDLLSGSVLVDLELELRQYQQSPDPAAWKLVLGMRAAALQLQHALEQQPVALDSLAVAKKAKDGAEFAAVRGMLLLESLRSFAAQHAQAAGKEDQATPLLLELLLNYPHSKLGWNDDAAGEQEQDQRLADLSDALGEVEELLQRATEGGSLSSYAATASQLASALTRFLGDAPLYELPEGVYNDMAIQVLSLMQAQEDECPQLGQLELWELLKGIITDENPLQSFMRGYLMAVLALDDADERLDALRELWDSVTSGEEVEVEAPAFDEESPIKTFDPLDAALQLVSSVSMTRAAIKQLPPALQGMDVLVTALRKVQKDVLRVQPLFQTEEEHRMMEEAAEEADADRERAASLITDKEEFVKEVTEKLFSLLHDPSTHPEPAKRLKTLLDMGANLQEVQEGFTPLHVVVATGDRQLLQQLLQQGGADVKQRSLPLASQISTLQQEKALLSALDLAALEGNWQAAELLLRHGASTSPDPETGLTPLHHAVSPPAQTMTTSLIENKRIVIGLLTKHRCPVNSVAKDSGATPLLLAVQYGLTPLVQALLKSKVDVNKADKTGLGPLHHAVLEGDDSPESAKFLRLLLSHKAKADQGPFMDEPQLAAVDLSPHHWQLPRSIQVLRSFGTPDAVLASVAAGPTQSLASLLYCNVVQRVAAVAGSRLSRHTKDVWWHDREAAKNFRKRLRLAVANSFHVKLTPYRLALLNEKWSLADILRPVTPNASRLQAPLSDVNKSGKLVVAVGDVLQEATVLENQHGYQYLLTHEGDNQARSNRRLQLAGLAPWVRRQGFLVMQPKVAEWDSEAVDWASCPDPDMRFQLELAEKHDYTVGYTKRTQYSTVDSNMVRVLDLSQVPDGAADIKNYGQALLRVLPAFAEK